MRKKLSAIASVLTIVLAMVAFLPFQACGDKVRFQNAEQSLLKSGQNGEGYGGKPTPYDFIERNRTCREIGANGRPLPNSQIFSFPNGLVQLVRENCVDIAPRTLTMQEYSWATDGTISFQNQSFVGNFSSDPLEVVAAACPAGKTLLANPVRKSFVRAGLNLQDSAWEHAGLAVDVQGSLASLPLYQLQRNDPNALESWHRIAQGEVLTTGQDYVYSFFIKPDAAEKAVFVSYNPSGHDFSIEFDLKTGAATVQSVNGVTFQSTQARMFAGGLYISIYFKALSDLQADMGVAPSTAQLGKTISITAIQLEKVSNFCSP